MFECNIPRFRLQIQRINPYILFANKNEINKNKQMKKKIFSNHQNVLRCNAEKKNLSSSVNKPCKSGSRSVSSKTNILHPLARHLSHLFSTHIKRSHLKCQMFLKPYSSLAHHFPANSNDSVRSRGSHVLHFNACIL